MIVGSVTGSTGGAAATGLEVEHAANNSETSASIGSERVMVRSP
jgi:hypothetical protein